MTRASQIFLFLGACTAFACGGDDDDGDFVIADSGPTVDSAPEVPACGDYNESNDATNNSLDPSGTAEATGVTVTAGGGPKVLCGRIDPTFAIPDQVADVDAFEFTVQAGAMEEIPFRLVMTSPEAEGNLADFGFLLQFIPAEGDPANVTGGGFVGGYALATNQSFIGGTFRLIVLAGTDPLPAAPIEYEIEIGERLPCDASADPAAYTEAKDGAGSRRNDVVTAAWANDPVTALTGATTDAPEPTELTLAADAAVRLTGTSAAVTARDDYRDKDTYLLAVGEGINEIDVRLTWPDGDVDMDTFVFAEDTADPALGSGTAIATNPDELYTVRVQPGNVWIWAGSYNEGAADLPITYDITVCPRNFAP